uniref:Integrase catalytic domain-containing protein n=1 Tax=Rhizophora mucronata TaxID=61149 RepID=A0A2P2MWN1_RHIMU
MIKAIRTNNGSEYIFNQFKAICISVGIQQQLTTPYSP